MSVHAALFAVAVCAASVFVCVLVGLLIGRVGEAVVGRRGRHRPRDPDQG